MSTLHKIPNFGVAFFQTTRAPKPASTVKQSFRKQLAFTLSSQFTVQTKKRKGGKMGALANSCFSLFLQPSTHRKSLNFITNFDGSSSKNSRKNEICCLVGENQSGSRSVSSEGKMEDYNTAMKRMMRNPYEYHHNLGMNYTIINDGLIVGSQPQKPEDIVHLKEEQNVAYILCLQQDKDIEYWGIDFHAIVKKCKEVGIRHMRRPARDFDPDSLRGQLPKAVSSLEWAISEGKGRVYVHCTAGLGRAPAVAITYLFWFCNMDLNAAYDTLTSKRPCGPNRTAIRGATYDLAKNDPWKEPFESLPDHAFADIADWERKLIQDRVRGLRGT